jgi:hypothetical protein
VSDIGFRNVGSTVETRPSTSACGSSPAPKPHSRTNVPCSIDRRFKSASAGGVGGTDGAGAAADGSAEALATAVAPAIGVADATESADTAALGEADGVVITTDDGGDVIRRTTTAKTASVTTMKDKITLKRTESPPQNLGL